jgi:hypothetical protein
VTAVTPGIEKRGRNVRALHPTPQEIPMKPALCVLLFFACLVLSVQARCTNLPPSCGDTNALINVATHGHGTLPAPPEAGKAKAVFIETADKNAMPVVTRIALDGTWLGANQGNSYFELTVLPGEHHICTDWELPHRWIKDSLAFDVFTAEAGKTYYFLVNVGWVQEYRQDPYMTLQLSPVNADEGQYLVLNSKVSTSTVKQ